MDVVADMGRGTCDPAISKVDLTSGQARPHEILHLDGSGRPTEIYHEGDTAMFPPELFATQASDTTGVKIEETKLIQTSGMAYMIQSLPPHQSKLRRMM